MDVTFVATPVGTAFRGDVVDLGTQHRVANTSLYESADTARSVAVAMWRAMTQPPAPRQAVNA